MDSPECFSGFAQVARNVLMELYNTGEYEITVFGINQPSLLDEFGSPRESKYPFKFIDAKYATEKELAMTGGRKDLYGREKLLKYMYENEFDIFFTIQDAFAVEFLTEPLQRLREKHGRKFRTVLYFPIDADNIPSQWINIAHTFDFPVVYSDYGYKQLERRVEKEHFSKFLKPIPHGTNVKDFYPYDEKKRAEKRAASFGDRFVVLNVARNQPRKDPCRSLAAFAEFKKQVPDAVYLFHCNPYDIGNDIVAESKYYGLKVNRDIFFPRELTEGSLEGVTIEQVNEAYNIADVLISTTLGEGWGLSTTEAMATKLPLVVPRNTATIEIVGEKEERGYLAASGNTKSLWTVLTGQMDSPPRPLTDIEDMVAKMMQVYNDKKSKNYEETETFKKVEEAYLYAQNHTWSTIAKERWIPLFEKVAMEVQSEKTAEVVEEAIKE